MRFTVRHLTRYRYEAPVQLAPHVLRLTPRGDGIREMHHNLAVTPVPSFRKQDIDDYGNAVTRLAFTGTTMEMVVESRFSLSTSVPPPLTASVLPPLPWPADPGFAACLDQPDPGPEVSAFARDIAEEAGGDPVRFLETLTLSLYTRTDRHIRPDGNAHTPAETLASARGTCRDLTVLFNAACRSLGLPAHFVSGYQARAETPDGRRHLHAWPEVHIPGVGWRGYDPTHGNPVTDGHVALAHAPGQAGTMPLDGGYYGAPVASRLDYEIEISAV